ncbi:MAG: hypothetical protein ACWA40_03845 [Planktomarina sp.]
MLSFFKTLDFDNAYETQVEQARKSKSADILENLAMGHAKVVVLNLFQYAVDHKVDVKIISGTLNEECYDAPVVQLAKKVLLNENRIDVLLTEADDDIHENAFAQLLNGNPNATLRSIQSDVPHFIVVGETAFRLEKDHDKVEAFLSFNHPETAKILSSRFDELARPLCNEVATVCMAG